MRLKLKEIIKILFFGPEKPKTFEIPERTKDISIYIDDDSLIDKEIKSLNERLSLLEELIGDIASTLQCAIDDVLTKEERQ